MNRITDWRVTLSLCGLAFILLLSYAVSGTAAHSLFLAAYGNAMLPYVWLAVAVAAAVSTMIVNQCAHRMSVVRLFVNTTYVSAFLLTVLLLGYVIKVPGMTFGIYIWKDIYIIVLVELFWTFANIAYGVDKASATYGLFCAAGSLGSIVGNLGIGPLAAHLGTFNSLWLTLPALWAVAWGCGRLVHTVTVQKPTTAPTRLRESVQQGWRILRQSQYLGLLLLLVAVVQVTITVLDFQFSEVLQETYPEVDSRTAVLGNVYAVINFVSLLLQIGTQPLLRWLGVSGNLLALPMLLGAALAVFVAVPRFATMAVVKVLSKCADYSVFRTSKEILYIPLSYAEKTQGKALVDMLTYRVAKGGASLIVLALTGFGTAVWVTVCNGFLCCAWLGLTVPIVRRYMRQVRT